MKETDTTTVILSEKAVQHITERHVKKAMRASQFYENINVTGLILKTITELERRKQEDNKRLYHLPREDQTVPYVYILPKTGSAFKVKCVNICYSIGKLLGGGDTDEMEIGFQFGARLPLLRRCFYVRIY